MTQQFLYQFLPGDRPGLSEGPDAWTDTDRAVTARHIEYLRGGAEDGIVVMAGRSQDWVGPAVVILECEDEATARAFMESDPFLTAGLFSASLHPYRIAIERS
jgi:uncharacterized protein YciI